MNYTEYYKKCAGDNAIDIEKFTFDRLASTNSNGLTELLEQDFLGKTSHEWAIFHPNWKKFMTQIEPMANQVCKKLEDSYYHCNIYVDKIYLYRSIAAPRTSSAIFHYDNNPPTVLKTMIYLSNVFGDSQGPIEFVDDYIVEPSRLGTGKWESPPNNSRISDSQLEGKKTTKIFGGVGTTTTFYPNCIHRANPPIGNNYRDVIVFRTRPTLERVPRLKYTTSFEVNGACPQNPESK